MHSAKCRTRPEALPQIGGDFCQRDPAASRREVTKRLTAIALGGVALSIVGAGEAEAQGQFRSVTTHNTRNMSKLQMVRAVTAETSRDRIAMAVYGDDQAFIDAVERAVLYIRSQNVPIDVVWADNVHAGGQNAIDIYIEGLRLLPGDGQPPFQVEVDANFIAQALVSSNNRWTSLKPSPDRAKD